MQISYDEVTGICEVRSTYDEAQEYYRAGVTFPAKAAGLTWSKVRRCWEGVMDESAVDELTMNIIMAAGDGLPGLTDPEPAKPFTAPKAVPVSATFLFDGVTFTVADHWEKGKADKVLYTGTGGKGTGCAFVTQRGEVKQWNRTIGQADFDRAVTACRAMIDGGIDAQKAATTAYAAATCHCAVCHRELTAAESVAWGIGPVCRGKLGGAWG